MMMKPFIEIEYCPRCGWLLRASYIAQELHTTFTDELRSISLIPSAETGRFQMKLEKKVIFDRKKYGGFADIKWFKITVRDLVAKNKSLVHADRHATL